jgi:hypothetical protein
VANYDARLARPKQGRDSGFNITSSATMTLELLRQCATRMSQGAGMPPTSTNCQHDGPTAGPFSLAREAYHTGRGLRVGSLRQIVASTCLDQPPWERMSHRYRADLELHQPRDILPA